ncbi:hypothetical protein OIB37_19455 [Streptomyces sp. NBC_00820]|uniref:hypothetical protein n=1 Tax=Streptomyces sp. NBC_00820 TaxID=2975842 RepID=UPI002ED003D2|nr:hypothetical protein OIB37_19455 [Streptomyces sp. NBC_00820]
MTPWLRLTLRLVRVLLVLAASVPAYGTATAYGAESAPPGSPAPSSAAARPPSSPAPSASPSPSASSGVPARVTSRESRSPSPSHVQPSRAGSRAGEGRMRPGRPDGRDPGEGADDDIPNGREHADPDNPGGDYPEEPETAETPGGTSAVSDAPTEAGADPAPTTLPPAQNAVQQSGGQTEPTLQILPLGSGLVLIGLGLALAFVGLRIRHY